MDVRPARRRRRRTPGGALKRRLAVAIGALVAALAVPGGASAHAVLVSSEPAPFAVLDSPPDDVVLRFSEPVGTVFASVRVLAADGTEVAAIGPAHGSSRSTVVAPLPPLDKGTWVVVWRVTSADGHPVQGSFTFRIGADQPDVVPELSAYDSAEHGLRSLFNVIRGAVLAGLIVAVGGAWLLGRDPSSRAGARSTMLVRGGTVVAAVASLQALVAFGPHASGLKIYAARDPGLLADTLTTAFGRWQVVRLVALGAMAWLAWRLERRGERWWRGAWSVAAATAIVSVSASGHPVTQSPAALSVALDAVHLSAVSLWLGGLVLLGADRRRWLGGARDAAVASFSRMAGFAVLTIVATGTAQSAVILGSPSELVDTRYGRLLAAKVAIAAVLVGIGGVSRALLRRSGVRSLSSSVVSEMVLGAAVVALTAVLTGIAPGDGRAAAAGEFAAQQVRGEIVASVTLVPARTGDNELHVVLVPPGGALDEPESIVARISFPGGGGRDALPPSPVPLERVGPNHATARVAVPFPGTWVLEVIVRPEASRSLLYRFEVPVGG